jgi:hypothetical protein
MKSDQQRLALAPPPPADVLPFPQVKRPHFIAKTAARVAAAKTQRAGENMLRAALDKQFNALARRGVAADRIVRQRYALECALRAYIRRLVLAPDTSDGAA